MEMDKKIFVAGHKGMVGSAIVRRLKQLGASHIITASREQLDLTNQNKVNSFFQKHKLDEEYMNNAGLDKYNHYNPNIDYNDWNDNLMHRFYMAKYEDRYLKPYPEFLVRKAIDDSTKKQQALEWIQNNLDSDYDKRIITCGMVILQLKN